MTVTDSLTGKRVEVPEPVRDSVIGLPPEMSEEEAERLLAEPEPEEDPGV
jgi:hypothetical protein